jgi:hypothetical protein
MTTHHTHHAHHAKHPDLETLGIVPFAVTPSGTTWPQFKAGNLKAVLDNLIAANPPIANPTVPATVASTVAASSLPVGTGYIASYTWNDTLGETLAGGASAPFNQADSAHTNTATIPALPAGALSANLYLYSPVTRQTSIYTSGITTTTVPLNAVLPTDVNSSAVPVMNTTGGAAHQGTIYALFGSTSNVGELKSIAQKMSNYTSGAPIAKNDMIRIFQRMAGIIGYWNQAMTEIQTLVNANPPSGLSYKFLGTGMAAPYWSLP